MNRLLLCSHDSELRKHVAATLDGKFILSVDSNPERVKDLCSQKKCDVVILDIEGQTDVRPFEFLDALRALDTPVVIVTGDNEPQTAMELVRRGIQTCCRKPLVPAELRILLRWAHEYAVAKGHLGQYRPESTINAECGQMVGSSPESKAIYDLIQRVANLDAYVLITGESGTGKELIARTIHSRSHRANNRFLAVSCGAVPETLIEAV